MAGSVTDTVVLVDIDVRSDVLTSFVNGNVVLIVVDGPSDEDTGVVVKFPLFVFDGSVDKYAGVVEASFVPFGPEGVVYATSLLASLVARKVATKM